MLDHLHNSCVYDQDSLKIALRHWSRYRMHHTRSLSLSIARRFAILAASMFLVCAALIGTQPAWAQVTPGHWAQQAPNGMPAMYGSSMAYNATTGNVVLFGGMSSSALMGSTFTWSEQYGWHNAFTTGPAARYGGMMVYDPKTGKVVLYGGTDGNGFYYQDMWTWDGTSWKQVTLSSNPVGPLAYGSITYDAATGNIVLFGGYNGTSNSGSTFTWNGTSWTNVTPATVTATNSPSARSHSMMAYDAKTGNVVLFGGGVYTTTTVYGDTWTWNGTKWAQQSPATSPPARLWGGMDYDPMIDGVVLFGGGNYPTDYQDTWIWSGGDWTQLSTITSPAARFATNLVYDARISQMVLFGGYDSSGTYYGDTWTLQLGALNMGTANVCSGGSTPSPCSQSAVLTFDLAANTTIGNVVYQAEDQAGTQFNITTPNSGSNQCLFIEGVTTGGATSCTVDITFTPKFPGLQKGAVVIVDSNGVPMAKTYVYGTGSGPLGAWTPGTISTAAGDGTTAILNTPYGVAVDHTGTNIYIADRGDNKVLKVNLSTNTLTTVAGTGTAGYSGDGGLATSATLNSPEGVAVDGAGNIYIADTGNSVIREVNAATGNISTVAGDNTIGNTGDGGPATSAELMLPAGVAVDGTGNIYIADAASQRIREVNATTGIISTVAGSGATGLFNGSYSGDGGPATSATLSEPSGVALDAAGDIYIADYANNRIREVNAATGIISTVAGNGTAGYSGDGGKATSAELNHPTGVAVDAAGDIYIGDYGNNVIREVNASSSNISTVAGNYASGAGYNQDGIAATSATLNSPYGVAVDGAGNIYIGDSANNRVRKVDVTTAPAMSFATTKVGSMSSDSPQTVTRQNIGNGTLNFPVPGSGYNPNVTTNFTYDDTTYSTTACPQLSSSSPAAGTLASAASCTVSIDFTPTTAGSPDTGTATLTDDSLNKTAQHTINLSGTATAPPVTQLAFGTPPPTTLTAGGNAGTVTVDDEDSSGNLASVSDSITLTVKDPSGNNSTYTATATNGVATFDLSSVTLTTAGSYSYSAASGNYTSATPATSTETVNAATASAISVVSGSGQSAAIGAAFTNPLVVKVADSYGNGISGATVAFTAPGSGASATLSTPAATGSNGETSVTATANGVVGPYSVTASTSSVSGNASFSLSNTKHAVTLAVTPSATSLAYGQPVTIKATITPSTVLGTAPTGSMTFFDGATTLSPTETVTNAAASYSVSVPTVGSHTYAATYSGDNNFQAGTKTNGPAVTVNKASSKLSGPTSTTVHYGQTGSIAISVTGQYSGTGIATPSGVIVYDIHNSNNTTVSSGTSTISNGAASIPVPSTLATGSYTVGVAYSGDSNYNAATTINVPLTVANATATVTLGNLSQTYTGSPLPVTVTTNPANLSVSVTYNGSTTVPTNAGSYAVVATVTDPNYSGSASGTLVIARAGTAVALTTSKANANLNASVTFTATVTSQVGTPAGSVQFLDGSTVLGTSQENSNGVATYSTSSLTAGLHQITAVYQGDTNYAGSTSAALAQTVTAPDFGLTSNKNSLTLKEGQTGQFTISMEPVGGFKGDVQFTCSGLPTLAQCTFSPASLTADGSNTTQTSTLTITTKGSTTGTVSMMTHPNKPDGTMLAGLFWLPALFFGGFLFWQRKKLTQKYRLMLILLVALATISGAVGCGSSMPHTAPGTSTITVTGTSGSTTQTVTVYVDVTK